MTRYMRHQESVIFPVIVGSCLSFFITLLFFIMSRVIHAAETDEVTLNLSATIASSCSMDRTGTIGSGAGTTASPEQVTLAESGAITLDFNLNCNSPFKYTLTSTNGALVYQGTSNVSANSDTILTQAAYQTTFSTALEDGDTTSINQTCSSSGLTGTTPKCNGGEFATSGTSVAIDESASLTVSLVGYSAPLLNGQPLLAGTYTDTLTLEVKIPP